MLKAEHQKSGCHNETFNAEENVLPASSQKNRQLIGDIVKISGPGAGTRQRVQHMENLVGECLDASHPTLIGRVLVQWRDIDGEERRQWLPTLQNLPVRKNDRLLLIKPKNWNEMIVTGVIDGFAKRPEIIHKTAGRIQLETDEAIRVTSKDGRELLELFQTDTGPVIRVLHEDTAIEFPGRLRLAANSIELEAGAGPINIKATDNVCINGEMIHLN